MNESEILELCYSLMEDLMNSDLYIDLKKKEKEMIDDQDSFALLMLYQDSFAKYEDAKRFEKYGADVNKAKEEFANVKQKVFANKLVKDYLEAYELMNKKLKEINNLVFKDIIEIKE